MCELKYLILNMAGLHDVHVKHTADDLFTWNTNTTEENCLNIKSVSESRLKWMLKLNMLIK